MASPALQAKAQALNARLEGEAKTSIDAIEKELIRPIARQSFACVVQCYDKAGKTGSSNELDQCSRQCQARYQGAHAILQQEVGSFQNRLSRAMMECNDKANDLMTPGAQNDPKQMKKIEDVAIKCISKTVDEYVGLLKPMRKRVSTQLDGLK